MGEKLPFRLILASASPARRFLLSRAGYAFDVTPSNIDRHPGPGARLVTLKPVLDEWLRAENDM